jgi:hypothetical protein
MSSQQAGIIEMLSYVSRMTWQKAYIVPDFSLISGQARRR